MATGSVGGAGDHHGTTTDVLHGQIKYLRVIWQISTMDLSSTCVLYGSCPVRLQPSLSSDVQKI
jgi:hypothetical protein